MLLLLWDQCKGAVVAALCVVRAVLADVCYASGWFVLVGVGVIGPWRFAVGGPL